MKIREKLLLAFGLYMFLAVMFGFIAYKDLNTITKRLELVEVADDITNALLETRRHEKNYLLFRDKDSVEQLMSYLGTLRTHINGIQEEIAREIGPENYGRLKKGIQDYERSAHKIVDIYTSQMELSSMVRQTGTQIEGRLRGTMRDKFLAVRSIENSLILRKDPLTYRAFLDDSSSLPRTEEIAQYRSLVDKLYSLHETEQESLENMRATARYIESFTKNLSIKERADVSAILSLSQKLLFLALIVVLTVGAAVNIQFARNVSRPIRELEEVTKKVADGDFSQVIMVRGKDEIASLARSFNQMGEQLRDTMNSLELAVKSLHTKQEQLIASEKLASLGRLSAGVAHEINNPLAIINEKAGLMKDILDLDRDLPQRKRFLAIVDSIMESVNRCRTITHRLLGFARSRVGVIEVFDMNAAVRDVLGFLEKDILLKNVSLELLLSEELPLIANDRTQLQQVLLNIIKNAVDAVPDRGRISVATRPREGGIQLTIADSGPGIPEDAIRHIFEPFYTTKEKGKGTGLGLFISYGIIKKLGGGISVESALGEGTTFTIELPLRIESIEGGEYRAETENPHPR